MLLRDLPIVLILYAKKNRQPRAGLLPVIHLRRVASNRLCLLPFIPVRIVKDKVV